MEDVTATVRQTLRENQPTLEEMYTHLTRDETNNTIVDETVTKSMMAAM